MFLGVIKELRLVCPGEEMPFTQFKKICFKHGGVYSPSSVRHKNAPVLRAGFIWRATEEDKLRACIAELEQVVERKIDGL